MPDKTTKPPAADKPKPKRDQLHFAVLHEPDAGLIDFVPFGTRLDALEHAAEKGTGWKAVTVAKAQSYTEATA